jgi:hypothetical protein
MVGLQIRMREVKEKVKLDTLHLEHVTIQSELRYLIGAQVVRLKCQVVGGKPAQWQRSRFLGWYNELPRSGSGYEPDPPPSRDLPPIANTCLSYQRLYRFTGYNLCNLVILWRMILSLGSKLLPPPPSVDVDDEEEY